MRYLAVLLVLAGLFLAGSQASAQGCWYRLLQAQDDGSLVESESWIPCPDAEATPETPAYLPTATLAPTLVPTATPIRPPLVPTATARPVATAAGIPTPVIAPTRTPNPRGRTLPANPSTVAGVIASALPGDTVALHAGLYSSMTLSTNAVTLAAFGDGPVTIDGGCTSPHAIVINGDDVAIRGLTVQNVVDSAILINGDFRQPARAIIEANTIQDYNCTDAGDGLAAGISAYYAGAGHRIVGNTISRRVHVAGSPRGRGDGIWFKSASGAGRVSGGGHYIAQNVITGGWDGIGGEVENDPHGAFDQNTVIEKNTISQCADDGIQLDGGGLNVYAQYNVIRECGAGISFAATLTGPTWVVGNDIESSTFGDLGQLICFKVGNASPSRVYVISNRCVAHGGKGLEQTNSGLGVIVARNNVYVVDSYAYEFTDSTAVPAGLSLDGDCIQASDPSRLAKWLNVAYGSLGAFQAASGQERTATTGPC